MRDRCCELCTKEKTGECKHCDALEASDRFCHRAGWFILIVIIVILGIVHAWKFLAALGIFLLFWGTICLLRIGGFWQTIFAYLTPEQRNKKLGKFLIWFFEATDNDGLRGVIYLVLGTICGILAALQIAPSATEWNWSIIVQVGEAVILAITAIIVWKYTRETTRLRVEAQRQVEVAQSQVRETQRQIEVQQRPFVIIQSVDNQGVWLRNIGNSSAINIKLWGARVSYNSVMLRRQNLTWDSLRSFESISSISHLDKQPTEMKIIIFDIGIQRSRVRQINLLSESHILLFRVEYDNVEMQSYSTEQGIRPTSRTLMPLKIFNSGKLDDKKYPDLISLELLDDGTVGSVLITSDGQKRIIEIIR